MGGKRMFGEFHLGAGAVCACWNNVLTRLQGMRENRTFGFVRHQPDLSVCCF